MYEDAGLGVAMKHNHKFIQNSVSDEFHRRMPSFAVLHTEVYSDEYPDTDDLAHAINSHGDASNA
jgi:hypothetical protein